MRTLLLILFLAGLVLPQFICAQPAPPPERLPLRLIAEGEDFTVKGDGWKVLPYRENYMASTFAISFLSRMGCLSAPEQLPAGQTTVAEQQITLPYAGEFRVLARYEQSYNFSCEFTVEIVQGGRTVYSQVYGRLQDPKIWALNGHQRVPMERYWWGGTDNIVWQDPGAAKLNAGPATIRLIAGAQMDGAKPRVNAAKRNVDVICLTDDTAGMAAQLNTRYLEMDGWLVQDGDLYLRITNKGDKPAAPDVKPNTDQHSPYYIHTRDWVGMKVLKSGYLPDPAKYLLTGPRALAVKPAMLAPALAPAQFNPIPAEAMLQPGDLSGWVPIGHMLDALHNCGWTMSTPVPLELEFAVPDGKGGLKTVKTAAITADTYFEIPGNINPNPALAKALKERWWLPEIRTQAEALNWLNAEVAKFPPKGPTAKRFLIYSIGGFGGTPGFPEGRKLMLALGDNTVVGQEGKKRGLVAHWPDVSPNYYTKANVDDVYVISYGDETHLPAADLTDAEFAAWLQAKGVKVDGPVKWTDNRNDSLYYYSVIAGVEKGAKPYIEATAYYKAKGALAGANYSPHANYLVSEMHWVRPFKMNAMSMPWSEDYVWQIPEWSVQVVGYMMTAFRCGAKYNHQPIHMYVMPHSPGNTPADFRRAFYTDVAHGMKMVNYFCASPMATGATENYVATDDLKMWREIYNVSHEAGQFEDYVMDGAVRPGKVGIILSSVDDVMTNSSNSSFAMHNNERKAIYYALRNAQVPVDMLSEDDVIDGLAKDYRVLYVTQQWMHSKCLAALQRWVENGGTVVALCGGGFLDEFNRPNPQANAFYGVKAQQLTTDPDLVTKYLLRDNSPFLTKQDLPLYVPIDTVTLADQDKPLPIEVIVWKQKLDAGDGQVLGTFKDGSPAVVRKQHGKGQVILFGFLPGQAYLKSGLPIRPADRGSTDDAFTHFLPTEMNPRLRWTLVDQFLPAGYVHPVECSETLVESTCIDSAGKLAVTLINYTPLPIGKLTVKIAGLGAAKTVRSIERGALKPTFQNGNMIVELPLDVADMLLIDK